MLLVILGGLGVVAAGVGGWLVLTGRAVVGGAILGVGGLALTAISVAYSGLLGLRSRARVEHEGGARLCRSHHVLIARFDPGTGAVHSPPDDAEPHIDVDLRLFNSGGNAVTLFKAEDATAAGQELEPHRYPGNFTGLRLEPHSPKVEQSFTLEAPKGEPLRAEAGDRVRFRIPTSDRRYVRVTLDLR